MSGPPGGAGPPGAPAPSARVRIRREAERARYDDAGVRAVLEDGVLAHVGFSAAHGVVVVPMLYAPCPGGLYLHGSPGAGVLRTLRSVPACVTVTLFDGLVVARSAFMTSANYRSVVAFGRARRLADGEKAAALDVLVEHVLPGRSAEIRRPTKEELDQTAVAYFEIDEASAKVREGGPQDQPGDVDAAVWAGWVPTPLVCAPPVPADDVGSGVPPPPSVAGFVARHRPPGC